MHNLINNPDAFFNRLEQTWLYYLDLEEAVHQKISEYNCHISEEGSKLFPEFVGFDDRYKGLLREGLLIQLCSLLEYSMVQVCKQILSDYTVKLNKIKRGDWLERHLKLLGQDNIVGLEADNVLYFSDFIRIRNCFVHSNGIVYQSKSPLNIKETVSRLQELGQIRGTNIIEISDDGYLVLGRDALPEVFSRGEEVMIPIFEHAFQKLAK